MMTIPLFLRTLARVAVMSAVMATSAAAQTEGCEPVAARAGRAFGCFITAREELGALPRDSALYWHIDAFPTQALAEAATVPRSTVVRSLDRIWLFTIAEAGWRPATGKRIALTGPLPLRGSKPGTRWRASSAWKPRMAFWYSGRRGQA